MPLLTLRCSHAPSRLQANEIARNKSLKLKNVSIGKHLMLHVHVVILGHSEHFSKCRKSVKKYLSYFQEDPRRSADKMPTKQVHDFLNFGLTYIKVDCLFFATLLKILCIKCE